MKKLKIIGFIIIIAIISLFLYMKISGQNINDIGLNVLSKIKKIKGESIDISTFDKKETEEFKKLIRGLTPFQIINNNTYFGQG